MRKRLGSRHGEFSKQTNHLYLPLWNRSKNFVFVDDVVAKNNKKRRKDNWHEN